MSEYIRGLKFKNENQTDDALTLLSELLETQVLCDVSHLAIFFVIFLNSFIHEQVRKESKDKTLYSVKYNCLKNVGFIYESKGKHQEAIEYLMKAIELDDTDVYTMNKLGQLALKSDKYEIAQLVFEKVFLKFHLKSNIKFTGFHSHSV